MVASEKSIGRAFYPSPAVRARAAAGSPAQAAARRARAAPGRRRRGARSTGGSTARSTTVVGSAGHGPASMTRSSRAPSASRIASASFERLARARQDQRRRQDRLAQLREQRLHDGVIGHAHADRAALRMLQPPRHLARGRQQERVACPACPAGRSGTASCRACAKWPISDRSRSTSVRWCASSTPRIWRMRLRRRRVADVAAERVARVGRIGDHAARRAGSPPPAG